MSRPEEVILFIIAFAAVLGIAYKYFNIYEVHFLEEFSE